MNIDAGLPVIKGERLTKGLTAYADFRRKALAGTSDDQKALASPELERFEVRVPTTVTPGGATVVEPVPEMPTRNPHTSGSNSRPPGVAPATTPRPQPTPAPSVPLPPRPIVKNPPRPTPAPVVPAPTAIEPQVTAANPPPTPGASTPPPAPAPARPAERRILTPSQTSALVDQFKPEQPTVLTGEFVVTGVLGQRVALRTRDSLRDANADPTQPGTTAAFIVVDFPPGVTPPAKDSVFSRDGEKGFMVRDVIRGPNGQITIVASESGR
jgi:hypothetical protein